MHAQPYDQVAAALREAAAQMTRTVGLARNNDTPLEALSADQIRAVVRDLVRGMSVRLAASDPEFDSELFIDAAGCGELPQHLADMRHRYESGGITVAQLAEQTGLRPTYVRDRLNEMGVRLGHKPRPPASFEPSTIHADGSTPPPAGNASSPDSHPAALARAFHTPGPPTGTGTSSQPTGHPAHPPQPPSPARRER